MAGDFPHLRGGGTARKALCIKAQRADECKKSWDNPGIGQTDIPGNICNPIALNGGKIRVIGSSLFTGFPHRYMRKIL